MGEQKVSKLKGKRKMQRFVKALLSDIHALEYMIENDWFDTGISRLGAEQEMVMVSSSTFKPAPIVTDVMKEAGSIEWVETELARFNLETTLTPREIKGSCFSELHKENSDKLNKLQEMLESHRAKIVLTGILPTLRKFDLDMSNITPMVRYKALMNSIEEQRESNSFELFISGVDELRIKHDSPFLEACNTSFQVHLQVDPQDFVKMYNIAQAIAGPVMAIGANSPIVFGKRLWHESRIALFQQSIDTRTSKEHMREKQARVSFGTDYIHDSIMDIYREDISRFRVLLSSDVEEDSSAMINAGKVPKLRALQVHNGTVYRWNRPCYGISDNGKPHLRIENRVLPSGPTVMDEVANACFWIGLMMGMAEEIDDVRKHLKFSHAHDNFGKAARYGAESKFVWFDGEVVPCQTLILERLLPIARKGLISRGIDQEDIDKYLGIIEGRARTGQTGSKWLINAYSELIEDTTKDEALTILTSCLVEYQRMNKPVHEWPTPSPEDLDHYRPDRLLVSEFMLTDIFTVRKEDILDLVSEMMDWKHLRYAPVEDKHGNLIGLISDRLILKDFVRNKKRRKTTTVEEIMVKKPITIGPDADILAAMKIMREKNIGCLPVVTGSELVGMITIMELLQISGRLIERLR